MAGTVIPGEQSQGKPVPTACPPLPWTSEKRQHLNREGNSTLGTGWQPHFPKDVAHHLFSLTWHKNLHLLIMCVLGVGNSASHLTEARVPHLQEEKMRACEVLLDFTEKL